jgi:aldose sugar dehydrogenase
MSRIGSALDASRRRAAAAALVAVWAAARAVAQPVLLDPLLTVQSAITTVQGTGLVGPTTMDFLAAGDFLVLEKDSGNVRRVLNGTLLAAPVLTLPVENASERGLLGIAIDRSVSPQAVFIYYTRDANDDGNPESNRIARFTWNGSDLVGETMLRDLPGGPGPNHDGGVLALDGSGLVYAMIGDLNLFGQLQNQAAGLPDDTSVILRLEQDGDAAPGNPLLPYCSNNPAQTCSTNANCTPGTCQTKVASYFAYGVRNGFGLAFDPATGNLWDTENGPGGPAFDEVNLVAPGFNSGWRDVMGPQVGGTNGGGDLGAFFVIPGSAYSDPEFSWRNAIAPTAILFPVGSNLGPSYDAVVLVGDVNTDDIYRLPLDAARTGFALASFPGLGDLVADDATERDRLLIGTGFGGVTDLEVGPDGDVYAVSIGNGNVYRISNPGHDFHTLTPCRVVDTRSGAALQNGVERVFTVGGTCGVPTPARAVSVNVTVVGPTGAGHVTVFPGNLTVPSTSTINFSAGQTRANNLMAPLATDGAGTLRALAVVAGGGTVHLILDVNGWVP